MDDRVIKNPARKKAVTREPYTPEYIRLGRDPVVNAVKSAEFMVSRKKRRQDLPEIDSGSMGPVPRSSVTRGASDEGVSFELASDPNEEIAYDDIPEPPVDIQDNPQEDDQSDSDLLDALLADSEESDDSDLDELKPDDLEPEDLNRTQPGEYCLYVCGILVAQGLGQEDAELIIQRFLSEDDPNFKEITINDIILMKRIPVRVGVLAME